MTPRKSEGDITTYQLMTTGSEVSLETNHVRLHVTQKTWTRKRTPATCPGL